MSVITPRPQRLREKQTYNQDTFRNEIRRAIDDALRKEPQDFEAFLRLLREAGYEIKTGKYTAVKGTGQQRFIRFRSLGAGYSDEDIRAVIAGKAVHRPKQKSIQVHQVVRFSLIFDLQQKLAEKGRQQERVKLPMWLNITLIVLFAAIAVTLILRFTVYKENQLMNYISSLLLGVT